MTTIGFDSDWREFSATHSHRATTSSRTGGRVHRGTVVVREFSGIDWEREPPVCVHGTRHAQVCARCRAVLCTHPGTVAHACEGAR